MPEDTKLNPDGTLPADFYDQDDSDNVCYLCGNPRYRLVYRVEHFGFPFTFKQCQCGLEKQTPMPNEKFFEWFFNSELFFSAKESKKDEIWGFYDYFRDEPSRMRTSEHRFSKLDYVFGSKARMDVMKIGPSTGTFLYVASKHGHNAVGCDISDKFASYAHDKYGLRIDKGRFEHQPYPDECFDVVMLLNVIENVPNQVEFLSAINRTLRPGGYFISNFVDMSNNLIAKLQKDKYFLYRPPICYAYTMDVYKKVMEKFGFNVARVHRDIRFMTPEKIFTLLRWRGMLKASELARISRIPLPVYAYPSKLVVAQKAGPVKV